MTHIRNHIILNDDYDGIGGADRSPSLLRQYGAGAAIYLAKGSVWGSRTSRAGNIISTIRNVDYGQTEKALLHIPTLVWPQTTATSAHTMTQRGEVGRCRISKNESTNPKKNAPFQNTNAGGYSIFGNAKLSKITEMRSTRHNKGMMNHASTSTIQCWIDVQIEKLSKVISFRRYHVYVYHSVLMFRRV